LIEEATQDAENEEDTPLRQKSPAKKKKWGDSPAFEKGDESVDMFIEEEVKHKYDVQYGIDFVSRISGNQ